MGTVPVPYTWQDEEIPDFNDMESRVADTLNFLMNPPMVRLRKTTTQFIVTSTSTPIIWDSIELETENMWDAALPTRIKPSTPGWYVGTFGASFAQNGTGYREFDIMKNNTVSLMAVRVKFDAYAAGSTVGRGTVFVESFNGTTDYIEARGWQNAGGGHNFDVASLEVQPDLTLRFLAPL